MQSRNAYILGSFVIPEGAATGARIEFDAENGRILIYNAANELVLSVSPLDGTDGSGNAVESGFTSYNPGSNTRANLESGTVKIQSMTMLDFFTYLQQGQLAITETGFVSDGFEMNFDADEGLNLRSYVAGARRAVWYGQDGFWYAGAIPGSGYDREVWKNLPLQNGWVAVVGNEPQYRLDADGSVYFRGWIRNGVTADNTVFATLPAGYRPAYNHTTPSANPFVTTFQKIDVEADGDMKVFGLGGVAWISLGIVPFKVAEVD